MSEITVSCAVSVVGISLLAFPLTYTVNAAQSLHGELGLFTAGVVSLLGVCTLANVALAGNALRSNWLLYAFTLGTFASAVDLIIGLETDGYLSGFMTNYLRDGEPYLGTPYGALISYWDGTAHYAMYWIMLAGMAYGFSYRDVGLYWSGSIAHSMLVLMPGSILGKFGVRWSFLLNVPYIFYPFMAAAKFLSEKPTKHTLDKVTSEKPTKHTPDKIKRSALGILQRPVDLLLFVLLIISTILTFLRGFAALGCTSHLTTAYIRDYEPYIADPVIYPKIQMLIYLFYFVPFFVMAIYELLQPGCSNMPDWALLFAGATAQGQFAHIVGSLHSRTPVIFHPPPGGRMVFWVVNLLLLVVPHLLAVRWRMYPSTSQNDVADTRQQTRKSKLM